MKKLNVIIAGLFLMSFSCFFSCNSSSSDEGNDTDTTIVKLEEKMDNLESGADSLSKGGNLDKEYTAKYICPDHCKGSGSDKAGTCADCGMELIENTSYKAK